MQDAHSTGSSLADLARSGYWQESRGPLASLIFTAPLLLIYEVGVLWLGPEAARNGADVWLRGLLGAIGFGQYFLLPLLAVSVLLGWHHLSGRPWRIAPRILGGMGLESLVFALLLLGVAHLQGQFFSRWARVEFGHVLAAAGPQAGLGEQLIGYLGAGIYEEVLFRLLLLPVVKVLARGLGASERASWWWAVAVTSVIFALAHYVGPLGDSWNWYSFLFRTAAGGFFAALFVWRGFGITAGAHAGYDLLVGLL